MNYYIINKTPIATEKDEVPKISILGQSPIKITKKEHDAAVKAQQLEIQSYNDEFAAASAKAKETKEKTRESVAKKLGITKDELISIL
jgi:hypothetical protein